MMLGKLLKASLSFMTIQRSLRVRWTKPRWRSDRQARPTKQTASRASCANVIPITSVADRSVRFQLVRSSIASLGCEGTLETRDGDFTERLFRAAYNRNAPWAVADFDAAQFLARFQIDNGDVV